MKDRIVKPAIRSSLYSVGLIPAYFRNALGFST